MSNNWPAEKAFYHGDYLLSPRGAFKLILQDDGNLVLYRLRCPGASEKDGGKAMWSSETWKPRGDPNFVNVAIFYGNGYIAMLKDELHKAWKDHVKVIGTPQAFGSRAVLQDDGNFVIYDAQNVPQWSSGTQSMADWMASVLDSTPISQLSIPGTHDTCATRDIGLDVIISVLKEIMSHGGFLIPPFLAPLLTIAAGVAALVESSQTENSSKCQTMTLREQLNAGMRCLDIRLHKFEGELVAWHGNFLENSDFFQSLPSEVRQNLIQYNGVNQRITFPEIFTICREFLRDHPRETLFMFIKFESDFDNQSMYDLETYIHAEYADTWYRETKMPETLEPVRGKIVLLRRYDRSSDMVERFGQQAGVDMKWYPGNEFGVTVNNGDQLYTIQDVYHQDNKDAGTAAAFKKEVVKDQIRASTANTDPKKFFFNFVSSYHTHPLTLITTSFDEIQIPETKMLSVGQGVNRDAVDFVKYHPNSKAGFILFDWMENYGDFEAIIYRNFE